MSKDNGSFIHSLAGNVYPSNTCWVSNSTLLNLEMGTALKHTRMYWKPSSLWELKAACHAKVPSGSWVAPFSECDSSAGSPFPKPHGWSFTKYDPSGRGELIAQVFGARVGVLVQWCVQSRPDNSHKQVLTLPRGVANSCLQFSHVTLEHSLLFNLS